MLNSKRSLKRVTLETGQMRIGFKSRRKQPQLLLEGAGGRLLVGMKRAAKPGIKLTASSGKQPTLLSETHR